MLLENLVQAKLIKRYKRFLADVELADGSVITAHCPNPGSMTGMADCGMNVYLSFSDSAKRKLPYTLRLVETASSLVVVDTMLANKLFKEAFETGVLSEFESYDVLATEQVIGDSRLDFLLTHSSHRRRCYVEVKSTTMWEDGHALFPDARTERGRKHLASLSAIIRNGETDQAAAQFYLIGRSDAVTFGPADHVDAQYGNALRAASEAGVQIHARALQFAYVDSGARDATSNVTHNKVTDSAKPDIERLNRGLPFDLRLTVSESVPINLTARPGGSMISL